MNENNTGNTSVDSGSFGWAIVGFLIPIVGLILFLLWKNSKPRSAKKAGIGALVYTILAFCFIYSILSSCSIL